jgi:hypothetical protein
MFLQHVDLSLSLFFLRVRLRWPLRPLPPALQSVSLLLSDGRSFCVWMILTAGPPLARVARHRLHHHRERAAAELLRHVVVRIYAGQLLRREVPVDEPVVLERILLLHRRAERDLVPVAQDARFSPGDAHAVDLRT